jgi:glutathione S-transferase
MPSSGHRPIAGGAAHTCRMPHEKTPELLVKNPFEHVPILEDGEHVLFDSNAILV